MCSALSDVRFVPIADVGLLIRSPHRRGRALSRNVEPQRLGGLEVDYEFKFYRLLNWQIARLFPFENLVNV